MTAIATALAVLIGASWVSVGGAEQQDVWDGIYSEAQAARGRKLYVNSCAACHQEGLQGADLAPALKGEAFILRWADHSMYELVDTIATTMPQDAPGSLTPQANVDIVAYVLQVNRFPTGQDELKPEAAGLKAIAITKSR